MRTKVKLKGGISLIVLVITIIVMIILAAAIILALSKTSIIDKSNNSAFQNDIKIMEEELMTKISEEMLKENGDVSKLNGVAEKVLTSANNDKYKGKFIIYEGKLKLLKHKSTEEEQNIAQKVNIEIKELSVNEAVILAYSEWESKTEVEKAKEESFTKYMQKKMAEMKEEIEIPKLEINEEEKIKEWVTSNYVMKDLIDEGKICNIINKEVFITGIEPGEMVKNYTEKGYKVYDLNSKEVKEDIKIGTGYVLKKEGIQVGTIVIYGDVDGNGRIASNDAVLVMRYCENMYTPKFAEKLAMDVNHDGKITAGDSETDDSKLILKIAAMFPGYNIKQNVKIPNERTY